MKITDRQLRRIIKETMADPTGYVPEPHVGSSAENGYVKAIQKWGSRTVIQAMLELMSAKGITDVDHQEILRGLR